MRLQWTQFRTDIERNDDELAAAVAARLGLPHSALLDLTILRKSLDARHKELAFVYTVQFELSQPDYEAHPQLHSTPNLSIVPEATQYPLPVFRARKEAIRPVVVGAGPAGLFAAWLLARAGLRPVVLERGDGIEARVARVESFWQTGILDPESNIQYGIGGAGTFSDGKLTTRVKDPRVREILQTLVTMGAPREIAYWQYPHIGTDLLREILVKMQQTIIDHEGEFRFRNRMTDIILRDGRLQVVRINEDQEVVTDRLIMATGNSGRDVYELFRRKGLPLTTKGFAVGVRIEHPQDLIDKAQYGRWAGHKQLGPAEYHLTYNDGETGRGVYSFCMCPGGRVIGAASEPGGVVTNGMSYQARNSGVANAAIVVTVNERDFGSGDGDPLAGMVWQRKLEEIAFRTGGGGFAAPAQRWIDFVKREPTVQFDGLVPSYRPGTRATNLWEVLPGPICEAIQNGIRHFGRQLRGFDGPEAVLTGVETRTSAPVRMPRDEDGQLTNVKGIYPAGEGAGYAGGIVSSALDGWKAAERVLEAIGARHEI